MAEEAIGLAFPSRWRSRSFGMTAQPTAFCYHRFG
jgi:hypothetical protein